MDHFAYARWPDQQTWEKSSSIPLPDNQAMAQMKDAIVSSENPDSNVAASRFLNNALPP